MEVGKARDIHSLLIEIWNLFPSGTSSKPSGFEKETRGGPESFPSRLGSPFRYSILPESGIGNMLKLEDNCMKCVFPHRHPHTQR